MIRTKNRSNFFGWCVFGLLVLSLLQCGKSESPTEPTSTARAKDQTHPSDASHILGKVFIVDGRGKPLEKIAAIATTHPNAFEEPISRGTLSGPDGISTIEVPRNRNVFIRAWDPILKYFPNNYFEIPPTDAEYLEDMTIVMLESGSIELVLMNKEGTPIRNENIGLMMLHPKLGPWWPVNSYSDAEGHVRFSPVPPGRYHLRIKTESDMILEIQDVQILPGEEIHLGVIKPT